MQVLLPYTYLQLPTSLNSMQIPLSLTFGQIYQSLLCVFSPVYHCLSPLYKQLSLSCMYLWGQISFICLPLLALPVLKSTVLGWPVHFSVSPVTVTVYVSPQRNWLKVQYDAVVLQPTTPPMLFTADTLYGWSTPVVFHHTVAMLVLHARETDRFSALQGADRKE